MYAVENSRWNRMGQPPVAPLYQNGEPVYEAPDNGGTEIPDSGELPPPSQQPAPENGGGVIELAQKNPMLTLALIFLLGRMSARLI